MDHLFRRMTSSDKFKGYEGERGSRKSREIAEDGDPYSPRKSKEWDAVARLASIDDLIERHNLDPALQACNAALTAYYRHLKTENASADPEFIEIIEAKRKIIMDINSLFSGPNPVVPLSLNEYEPPSPR